MLDAFCFGDSGYCFPTARVRDLFRMKEGSLAVDEDE